MNKPIASYTDLQGQTGLQGSTGFQDYARGYYANYVDPGFVNSNNTYIELTNSLPQQETKNQEKKQSKNSKKQQEKNDVS